MMNTIGEITRTIAPYITLYALAATFVIIAITRNMRRNKARYIHWKSEKINLVGLYETSWERNNDELLTDLWEENRALEAKVKLLNKDKTNLSITTLILLIMVTLLSPKKS